MERCMDCNSLLTKEEKVDRKSTRLNSSHSQISYAVFCLKKKKSIKIYSDARTFSRSHCSSDGSTKVSTLPETSRLFRRSLVCACTCGATTSVLRSSAIP